MGQFLRWLSGWEEDLLGRSRDRGFESRLIWAECDTAEDLVWWGCEWLNARDRREEEWTRELETEVGATRDKLSIILPAGSGGPEPEGDSCKWRASREFPEIGRSLSDDNTPLTSDSAHSKLSHESAMARGLSHTPRASSRSPRPGVDFFRTGPASVYGSLHFWVGKAGDGTDDNGEAEDTFECLGVLVWFWKRYF